MVIRSYKTKLLHEISQEDWQIIVKRGDANKYQIVKQSAAIQQPTNKAVEYRRLLREANKFFDNEDYDEALVLYNKAYAIRATKKVEEKIKLLSD